MTLQHLCSTSELNYCVIECICELIITVDLGNVVLWLLSWWLTDQIVCLLMA